MRVRGRRDSMADEKEGKSARREAGSSPASVGWMRCLRPQGQVACVLGGVGEERVAKRACGGVGGREGRRRGAGGGGRHAEVRCQRRRRHGAEGEGRTSVRGEVGHGRHRLHQGLRGQHGPGEGG
eukprot:648029-Pleurochrysis_carterae.AAC.1